MCPEYLRLKNVRTTLPSTPTFRDENVLGLEVPVQDALAVHMVQRKHDLHKPADEMIRRRVTVITSCWQKLRWP